MGGTSVLKVRIPPRPYGIHIAAAAVGLTVEQFAGGAVGVALVEGFVNERPSVKRKRGGQAEQHGGTGRFQVKRIQFLGFPGIKSPQGPDADHCGEMEGWFKTHQVNGGGEAGRACRWSRAGRSWARG